MPRHAPCSSIASAAFFSPSRSANSGRRAAARAIRAVDRRAPRRSAPRSSTRHDTAVSSHYSRATPNEYPARVSGRQGSRMSAIAIRFGPTLRLRVNPAMGLSGPQGVSGSADHRTRRNSRAPLSCGHDNERKSERTSDLTTPPGEEIRLIGRDDRLLSPLAQQRPDRSDLSARNLRWRLRASCSTIKYAPSCAARRF